MEDGESRIDNLSSIFDLDPQGCISLTVREPSVIGSKS